MSTFRNCHRSEMGPKNLRSQQYSFQLFIHSPPLTQTSIPADPDAKNGAFDHHKDHKKPDEIIYEMKHILNCGFEIK